MESISLTIDFTICGIDSDPASNCPVNVCPATLYSTSNIFGSDDDILHFPSKLREVSPGHSVFTTNHPDDLNSVITSSTLDLFLHSALAILFAASHENVMLASSPIPFFPIILSSLPVEESNFLVISFNE
ncbi:MAG: hypothetical protein U9N86_09210 [Bacteroidota bacterium]|nr:hypothetical protein [Bacteroidota bacterium]